MFLEAQGFNIKKNVLNQDDEGEFRENVLDINTSVLH